MTYTPLLCQDLSRHLSRWFASRIDARWVVRRMCFADMRGVRVQRSVRPGSHHAQGAARTHEAGATGPGALTTEQADRLAESTDDRDDERRSSRPECA
jgi:hypothetical protein